MKRRKQRQRTNKNIPAKGRLKDMCDSLWSFAVREDWGNHCAACPSLKCEAHHLVPRQNQATRYDLRNGIALCASHHQFDHHVSPHQNAAGFLMWLMLAYPETYKWYMKATANGTREWDGTTNAVYYCDVIWSFKRYVPDETFKLIVGIKFSAWLESEHAEDCP